MNQPPNSIDVCADCNKPAVVGWSQSPHFPPPTWLCADHFEVRLDIARQLELCGNAHPAP